MESMGVPLGHRPSQPDQGMVNIKWAWNNWVGGWTSSDPFKTVVRRSRLSRAQFEPGEVEFLKAAWAGKAGDEKIIDRESARGVILEKLDVSGLTESEVDEIIAKVVKERESVDQEEFLRVRPFYLDYFFGLLGGYANIGTIGVRYAQGLGCCSAIVEKDPQVREEGHPSRGEWRGCVISSKNSPDYPSYYFALHARKLPIPSVLGRLQQPDPFPTSSASSLILAKKNFTYHNVALPWKIFTVKGTNTLALVVLWYTLASSSIPGEMVPLTQAWTRESAPLGLFECPSLASALFDNHAYSRLQLVHHLNIRIAHSTPAKVSAMASSPTQEMSMHLNSPKPLPLS